MRTYLEIITSLQLRQLKEFSKKTKRIIQGGFAKR